MCIALMRLKIIHLHSIRGQYYPQIMHKRIHQCKFVVLSFIDGRTLNKLNIEQTQFSVQTKKLIATSESMHSNSQMRQWIISLFLFDNKLPFKTIPWFVHWMMFESENILLLFLKCKIKSKENQAINTNENSFRWNVYEYVELSWRIKAIDNQNCLQCTAQHTTYISETASDALLFIVICSVLTCAEGVKINTY